MDRIFEEGAPLGVSSVQLAGLWTSVLKGKDPTARIYMRWALRWRIFLPNGDSICTHCCDIALKSEEQDNEVTQWGGE